jgi:FlaA1/EpsC-like NDP-sugar epimerase
MSSDIGALDYPRSVAPAASGYSLTTQRSVLVSWLVLTDVLALAAAFWAAYWIRFDLQITVAPEVVGSVEGYNWLSAFLIPLWIFVFAVFNLYDPHGRIGGILESSWTFNACTIATMLVIVATFLAPQLTISRMWLVSVWLLSAAFVTGNRFVARRIIYSFRRRGYLLSPTLIVGTNEEASALATSLSDWHALGVRTMGMLTTTGGSQAASIPLPVLGSVRDIAAIVSEHQAEDLIIAITAVSREELLRLCEEVDSLPVRLRLSSGLYELLTTRVSVQNVGTVPLMSLQKNRLHRG